MDARRCVKQTALQPAGKARVHFYNGRENDGITAILRRGNDTPF